MHKITQKQIKQIFGYVSKESDILTMLKSFYFGSQSPLLSYSKISETIYQITAPNGLVKNDLFILKSGRKKIKYHLVSI